MCREPAQVLLAVTGFAVAGRLRRGFGVECHLVLRRHLRITRAAAGQVVDLAVRLPNTAPCAAVLAGLGLAGCAAAVTTGAAPAGL
jgi:hypothetical protein